MKKFRDFLKEQPTNVTGGVAKFDKYLFPIDDDTLTPGQNIFTLNLIILAKAVDLHAVHRKCLRSIDLAFQKFTH